MKTLSFTVHQYKLIRQSRTASVQSTQFFVSLEIFRNLHKEVKWSLITISGTREARDLMSPYLLQFPSILGKRIGNVPIHKCRCKVKAKLKQRYNESCGALAWHVRSPEFNLQHEKEWRDLNIYDKACFYVGTATRMWILRDFLTALI